MTHTQAASFYNGMGVREQQLSAQPESVRREGLVLAALGLLIKAVARCFPLVPSPRMGKNRVIPSPGCVSWFLYVASIVPRLPNCFAGESGTGLASPMPTMKR